MQLVLTPALPGLFSAQFHYVATRPGPGPWVANFPVQLLPREQRIILSEAVSVPVSLLLCLLCPCVKHSLQTKRSAHTSLQESVGRRSAEGWRAEGWTSGGGQLCFYVAHLLV